MFSLNSNKVFTKNATQRIVTITDILEADGYINFNGVIQVDIAGNYSEILCIKLTNTCIQFKLSVFSKIFQIRSAHVVNGTTSWTDWKQLS